jgi:dihydrofolate reductase
MKTLLYMAVSANGCIADSRGNTPWSDAEWKNFNKAARSCGNIIVGRTTFKLMAKSGDFDRMGKACVVVVSRTLKITSVRGCNVVSTPKEALKFIQAKGFSKAFIAGGTKLNSSFIEQKLVDEMVLDVEPHLFVGGMPLLESAKPFVQSLKLVSAKPYRGGVSLHYRLAKK